MAEQKNQNRFSESGHAADETSFLEFEYPAEVEPPNGLIFEFGKEPEQKEEIAAEPEALRPAEVGPFVDTTPKPEFSAQAPYMPRFTEVSDRFNRREPIYDPAKQPDYVPPVDPTAELDEASDDLPTVKSGYADLDELPDISVMKFEDAEADAAPTEPVPEPEPLTPEQELAEEIGQIEMLLGDTAGNEDVEMPVEEDPDPEEKDLPEEIPEEPAEAEQVEEKKQPAGFLSDYPVPAETAAMAYTAQDLYGTGTAEENAPVPKQSQLLPRHLSEFVSNSQFDAFKDRFLDQIFSLRVRLIFTAILAVLLAVFESVFSLASDPLRLFNMQAFPASAAWIDLFVVICFFVVTLPELIRGFRELLQRHLSGPIYLFLAEIVVAIYTLVIALTGATSFCLGGSIVGLISLSMIIGSCLEKKAEFENFKMVSRPGEKLVTDKQLTRHLPEENFALDGAIDEYSSRIVRSFKTTFVADFFSRTKKRSHHSRETLIFLCIATATALVCGVIGGLIGKHPVFGIGSALLAVSLTVPVFLVSSRRFAYAAASKIALGGESAVIGEGSLEDYSAVDVIAFEDTEVFGDEDVSLKKMLLFCDQAKYEKIARRQMSLITSIGGQLARLFAGMFDGKCAPCTDPKIEDDGVSATVEGHFVMAGSRAYMERNGIAVPATTATPETDTTRIFYSAEDGRLTAEFAIHYSFSETFTRLIPFFKKYGFKALIYTRDPNLSSEMMDALTMNAGVIRLLKKHNTKPLADHVYPSLSSPLVTLGEKDNIVSLLLLSRRFVRFERITERVALAFAAVGVVGSILLSILMPTKIPVLPILGWQILWYVLFFLLVRFFFPRGENKS